MGKRVVVLAGILGGCGDVGTRDDGKVTYFQRYNLDIGSLSSSGCAPCGD